MFKKIICTKHAIQRYEQRTNKTKQDTVKRMIRDIKALRNKQIVKIGTSYHVFYKQPSKNVREFILTQDDKDKDVFHCVTVIARNPKASEHIYNKRLRQKRKYENSVKN